MRPEGPPPPKDGPHRISSLGGSEQAWPDGKTLTFARSSTRSQGNGVLQEGDVVIGGGASGQRRTGQTLIGIQMTKYFEGGLTIFPMPKQTPGRGV